jgi:hypothetical protein
VRLALDRANLADCDLDANLMAEDAALLHLVPDHGTHFTFIHGQRGAFQLEANRSPQLVAADRALGRVLDGLRRRRVLGRRVLDDRQEPLLDGPRHLLDLRGYQRRHILSRSRAGLAVAARSMHPGLVAHLGDGLAGQVLLAAGPAVAGKRRGDGRPDCIPRPAHRRRHRRLHKLLWALTLW